MESYSVGVFLDLLAICFHFASIPQAIENANAGLGLCVIAIITLSAGLGLMKPNLLPLVLDQYPEERDMVKVLPTGELIILDREKSLSRITNVFYLAINIGAFCKLLLRIVKESWVLACILCSYDIVHNCTNFLIYCET